MDLKRIVFKNIFLKSFSKVYANLMLEISLDYFKTIFNPFFQNVSQIPNILILRIRALLAIKKAKFHFMSGQTKSFLTESSGATTFKLNMPFAQP